MCCSPDSAALAAAAGPRLDRLRAACADAGMGAFFVRDTSNIAWLTAFDGVFDDEDAHALLVTPSDAVLHTDSRYSEAARAAAAREGAVAVDDARVTHAKFVAETFAARHADRPSVEAEAIALGIEDSMSLAGFRALEAAFAEVPERPKLRETSDFIVNLRAVKDVQEIARMKAAQAVTDAAFAHIVGYMRPGMTEREVQIELEDFMRRHGAEGLAFPSIVAAGANGQLASGRSAVSLREPRLRGARQRFRRAARCGPAFLISAQEARADQSPVFKSGAISDKYIHVGHYRRIWQKNRDR